MRTADGLLDCCVLVLLGNMGTPHRIRDNLKRKQETNVFLLLNSESQKDTLGYLNSWITAWIINTLSQSSTLQSCDDMIFEFDVIHKLTLLPHNLYQTFSDITVHSWTL